MPNKARITGQKFGRLIARRATALRVSKKIMWECDCECGKIIMASVGALRGGNTRSCGCLRDDALRSRATTHGATVGAEGKYGAFPKTYRVWLAMRYRCSNPNTIGWANYGGRGIRVCDEWQANFEIFLRDMGECPAGMSIDRINVDGNYEPANCRWATRVEQARNSRQVQTVIVDGDTLRIPDACDKYGVKLGSLRVIAARHKMSHADAFFRLHARTDRRVKLAVELVRP